MMTLPSFFLVNFLNRSILQSSSGLVQSKLLGIIVYWFSLTNLMTTAKSEEPDTLVSDKKVSCDKKV